MNESASYRIGADGQSITCLICSLTSYNPNDVREVYCGNCHRFHRVSQEAAYARNVNLLSDAGEALYGRHWIPQFSEAIGLPYREIHAMARGRRPIPAYLWIDIRRLIRDRQRELSAVAREIRAEINRDD